MTDRPTDEELDKFADTMKEFEEWKKGYGRWHDDASNGLKSCPFCGSTEIHIYEPTIYEMGNDASVNCENPICSAEVRGHTLKEAIAKWNRRMNE